MAAPAPTETATVPQAAPAAPAPAPVTTQTVRRETFVDGAGQLYQVDATPSEIAKARGIGLRPASLDEAIEAERQVAADSIAGQTVAFATGAVPGLATGLVKGASLYGATPEEAADAVTRSQEVNPYSEGAGFVGGLLLPTGAAKIAKAGGLLRGALGARALAEAGGLGAAELAEGAAQVGTKAAQASRTVQALQAGARVGAEGAAYGGLGHMDETALGDPNANGQKLVASFGEGALWGGVLGFGLGAGTKLVGGLIRRAPAASLSEAMGDAERVSGMGEKAFGPGGKEVAHEAAAYEAKVEKASQQVGVRADEMRAALHEAQSAATTATETTLERAETSTERAATKGATTGTVNAEGVGDAVLKKIFGKNEEAYQAASAIWKERLNSLSVQEARLDANAGKLVDAGNAALKAESAMQKVAYGEAKAEQMAGLVDPAKWEAAQNATFTALQDARAVTNELAALETKGGAELGVKRVSAALTDAEAASEKLLQAPDKGAALKDYFVKLDSLKRTVGKAAEFGKSAVGLSEGAREFDKLYERLRVVMEDQNAWGKAGAAQREINAATTEALSTYKKFSGDFVREYGAEAGRPIFEFRSDAAKNHLSNVLEFGERDKARGLNDWANGLERRLNAVEKHYGLSASEKAEFQKGREALQELRKTLGEATMDATKVAKIRAIQAEERAGALGGTLGMLTSALTQPISTVARIGEMRVALTSVGERITNAAKNIVEKQGTTTTATSREASRTLARTSLNAEGKATQEAASMSASASMEKRREATIAAMDRVRNISTNPTAMAANITRAVERYANHAPETSAAASATMGRGIGYLASRIPPGGPTQPSVQPFQQKPRYSDSEIRDFADRYLGVTNPLSLLDDMSNGTVSRAKVEAVREVYPEVFQQIQEQIALTAASSEKPLSWERIKMLAVVYGVPTHPAFDPKFIAAVQAPMQAAASEAPPPGGHPPQGAPTGHYSSRPMDLKPENYQTPTERIATQ